MLDDHVCDSNHKKLLAITENLHTRFIDATIMVGQADGYYLEITHTVNHATLTMWEDEVKEAERMRQTDVKVMDVYAARLPDWSTGELSILPAPALAPIDQWMEFSLLIEEIQ